MAEKRHIITHRDGRSYSVTKDAFTKLYEPEGFKLGDEETPAAFQVVGVPAPGIRRGSPRAKRPARDRSKATKSLGSLPESRAEVVVDEKATDADGG